MNRSSKHNFELANPVFLIGFMGAGKTSVARRIARTCGVSSIDLDTYLERKEGKKVSDIFAKSGEDEFRNIETEVLREVVAMPTANIVSCGGGIVLRPENVRAMQNAGTIVHLRVTADEASGRIGNKSTRPLFNSIEAARERCKSRMPLYEDAADFTIDTAGLSVSSISDELRRELIERNILCPQQQ